MPSGSYADRLRSSRVYLVLEAAAASAVEPALRGGVDLVQLRDKDASDEEILRAGRELRELCAAHGALFLVNDRPDLAVACGADGVHVGQDDVPAAVARRIVGPDVLVGLSTHAPAELGAAAAEPVDYVSDGPV